METYRMGAVIKTVGIDELTRELGRFSKSIQAKRGLINKMKAETTAKYIKQLIEEWNVTDTADLYNAIAVRKIGPYTWIVGDLDYPVGVYPHGFFVEYGFQRHWIHRSMVNPWSKRLAWFVASDKEFIEVGPMGPRPVFEYGENLAKLEYLPKEIEQIDEIIADSFKGGEIAIVPMGR